MPWGANYTRTVPVAVHRVAEALGRGPAPGVPGGARRPILALYLQHIEPPDAFVDEDVIELLAGTLHDVLYAMCKVGQGVIAVHLKAAGEAGVPLEEVTVALHAAHHGVGGAHLDVGCGHVYMCWLWAYIYIYIYIYAHVHPCRQ